jgi:uncharacterized protein
MAALLFKHVAVRDLAWVMASPRLVSGSHGACQLVSDDYCQLLYRQNIAQLQSIDEAPQDFFHYLQGCANHRLGAYFEVLLAYWFSHILAVQRFQKNIPVYQNLVTGGRKTLGEFDFLFQKKGQKPVQHWEVTIKFYLQCGHKNGVMQWLGPGGCDRFETKLEKIFQHQLILSSLPEAAEVLQGAGFPVLQSAAFIKGYLFYPVCEQASLRVAPLSSQCNALTLSRQHLRGWWLRHGECVYPKNSADSQWLLLAKMRWLSSAYCRQHSVDLMDDQALIAYCKQHFSSESTSLLVAEMQPSAEGWHEVARGFVVDARWGEEY